MQKTINDWNNYLEAEGKSAETIRAYMWHVQKMAARFPGKKPGKYKFGELLEYIVERKKAGWGDSSRKLAVNAMRSFFLFAVGANKSPAVRLPMPHPKVKAQRTLTADQAFAVLSSCDTGTARGQRDLALMCLFMDTRLRNTEVCRLAMSEVSLTERNLETIVKGGNAGRGDSASTPPCS